MFFEEISTILRDLYCIVLKFECTYCGSLTHAAFFLNGDRGRGGGKSPSLRGRGVAGPSGLTLDREGEVNHDKPAVGWPYSQLTGL